MKILYKHLADRIKNTTSIDEVSEHLIQLGHEHDVENDIFDFEFTPNRGDCLSINGLLRDLSVFYDINFDIEEYDRDIDPLEINFNNLATSECPKISFLYIEIDKVNSNYQDYLDSYFEELGIKKNNFFTDISNYLSYEFGQPTHCYEYQEIEKDITFSIIDDNVSFETLLGTSINLNNKNAVFLSNNKIINLAGVIGGKKTSCSKSTKSVLVECAYFNPEIIIGKSIKYDINSDAAYKFERGVDPSSHEKVLRRFIKIVEDHTSIKQVKLFSKSFIEIPKTTIRSDIDSINRILGTNLLKNDFEDILQKLQFKIENDLVIVPYHRSDIKNINDIAEEIARTIGYDNIDVNEITNLNPVSNEIENKEFHLRRFLVDNGFFEAINSPFTSINDDESIQVDNPLDSNKCFLRKDLKQSLIDNLLYNERRQHDSIKLFEISNIFSNNKDNQNSKKVSIIATGRVGKNYRDFSKTINEDYLMDIFSNIVPDSLLNFEEISRNNLNSKQKSPIYFLELYLSDFFDNTDELRLHSYPPTSYINYKKVSELPASVRDLSISVIDFSVLKELEQSVLNFSNSLIKEIFIFDFYENKKLNQIKIGFRFIFQSSDKTLTDQEIDSVMNVIIEIITKINGVEIPGLGN